MSPREQLNHIDEGDYVWCPECDGSNRHCSLCDGEGIVHCDDADKAGSQPVKRRAYG